MAYVGGLCHTGHGTAINLVIIDFFVFLPFMNGEVNP